MNRIICILSFLTCLTIQSIQAQIANTVGDAVDLGGDCFQITPNQQYQSGAVWYNEQLDLTKYFSLTVEMNLGSTDGEGADGCILAMQTQGLDALGVTGQFLGFGGITPSFGLEFDTFNNETFEFNGDIGADHMAMLRDGNTNHNSADNLAGPVSIFPGGGNAENGQSISLRLVWNPATQQISAYMNCVLRLTTTIDLIDDVFGGETSVYWGFTGATGFYDNEHSACLIEVSYLNPTLSEVICEGENIQLTVNSNTANNIVWSPNQNIDDVNSATPFVSPSINTTYTVEYDKCGEVFSDTVHVDVISLTLAEIDDVSVCPSESSEFTAVYNPLYDIEWSNGDLSSNSSVYTGIGEHWVEVTDGTCVKREAFNLVEAVLPSIVAPSTVTYCAQDSVLIQLSALNSYTYDPFGIESNEFYISLEGDYEVTALDTITGCQNTMQIEVSELPLPVISLNETYEICPYEVLEISIDNSYSADWSNGSVDNESIYTEAGIHSVEAELNGCVDSLEFELLVNPIPISNIPGNYSFCEDSILTLTSANAGYTITWHDGSAGTSFNFIEGGEFMIEVENNLSGCISIGTIEIEKIFNPILEVEEIYDLCEGGALEVEPFYENSQMLVWSNGFEGDAYVFSEPGEVYVLASNECKEQVEIFQIESVVCDCVPFIPLAFTPDNDGINEVFKPIITCVPFQYHLSIFNRWGEIVFDSIDPEEGWVGNDKNGDHYVPSGVYTYTLSYKSEQFDGVNVEIRNGMVSVIR